MSNQETSRAQKTKGSFADFRRSFARLAVLRRRRSASGSRSLFEKIRRLAPFFLLAFVLPTICGNWLHVHEEARRERAENAAVSAPNPVANVAPGESALVVPDDENDASHCPICRFFSHCQTFAVSFSADASDDATLKIAPTPSQVLSSTAVLTPRGRAPPRALFAC